MLILGFKGLKVVKTGVMDAGHVKHLMVQAYLYF